MGVLEKGKVKKKNNGTLVKNCLKKMIAFVHKKMKRSVVLVKEDLKR